MRHRYAFGAVLLAVGCASAQPDVEPGHARYRHCGLEYALPDVLRVSVDSTTAQYGALCTITADPVTRSPDDLQDLSALSMNVYGGRFEQVAADAGFEEREGGWVVLGRHAMPGPADTISGNGWRGVEGTATIGRFSEEGYAGLGEVYRAVLTDGRSVVAVDATFEVEEAISALRATLRFLR